MIIRFRGLLFWIWEIVGRLEALLGGGIPLELEVLGESLGFLLREILGPEYFEGLEEFLRESYYFFLMRLFNI